MLISEATVNAAKGNFNLASWGVGLLCGSNSSNFATALNNGFITDSSCVMKI